MTESEEKSYKIRYYSLVLSQLVDWLEEDESNYFLLKDELDRLKDRLFPRETNEQH